MAELQFDAASHRYTLDGRVLPSVTQILSILQDFSGVPADVLERAREFGVHVHQAVDLYNRDELDEASLDPALAPYLAGWHSFLRDCAVQVVQSELRLADAKLGFAGTCDAVVRIKGVPAVVDVKTGVVPRTVALQLAAYAYLLKANQYGAIRRRLCVQLTGDGYRIHEFKDPADWSLFLSACNCWRFIHAC